MLVWRKELSRLSENQAGLHRNKFNLRKKRFFVKKNIAPPLHPTWNPAPLSSSALLLWSATFFFLHETKLPAPPALPVTCTSQHVFCWPSPLPSGPYMLGALLYFLNPKTRSDSLSVLVYALSLSWSLCVSLYCSEFLWVTLRLSELPESFSASLRVWESESVVQSFDTFSIPWIFL